MYAEDGVSPGTITLGNATGTYADLVNQGTINTSGPGDLVYIETKGFTNDGRVSAPALSGSAVRDVAGVFEALGAAPLWVMGPEVERAQARLAEGKARGSTPGPRRGQVPQTQFIVGQSHVIARNEVTKQSISFPQSVRLRVAASRMCAMRRRRWIASLRAQ